MSEKLTEEVSEKTSHKMREIRCKDCGRELTLLDNQDNYCNECYSPPPKFDEN